MSALENQFQVCTSEFDPDRCQATESGTRECKYKRIPPSLYCPRHGGLANQHLQKRATLAHYRLAQYNDRLAPLANSPEIKSLRDEIAIMRMTLETVVAACKNENMLLIASDRIMNMAGQIGVLIERCQKIEERNSDLLDRKVVMVIADQLINIIKVYITDPEQILKVGEEISETIMQIGSIQTLKAG